MIDIDIPLPYDWGMETKTENMFAGLTADEWRKRASRSFKNASDSWDRSDTDGFLSQWAGNVMGGKYIALAGIAEDGGTIVISALFDLNGKFVPARLVDTAYGCSWGLIDSEDPERFSGWFNPSNAKNESRRIANNAKKGFYIGSIRVRPKLNRNTMDAWAHPDGKFEIVEVIDNGKCAPDER